MTRILIIYHSQTGHTARMAERVAAGAGSVPGTEVLLKRAAEASLYDLLDCDGLAIGSPEYFGYMAGMLKDFFDRTYEPARRDRRIFKKPYVIFVSAGNDGSGAVNQIERICRGYPLKKVHDPIVAKGELSEAILGRCEVMGRTIAAGCDLGIY